MQLNLIAGAACLVIALPTMAADVSYRADVAPIIKKYCAGC